MADHVLAVLRRLMTWHASRSDEFRSPIVRSMARTKPRESARERVLTDDELRAVPAATQSQYDPGVAAPIPPCAVRRGGRADVRHPWQATGGRQR